MKRLFLIAIALLPAITSAQTNIAPISKAGPDQVVMDIDHNLEHVVTLSGNASTDEGSIVKYEWRSINGTFLKSGVSFDTVLTLGTHEFVLIVTDNGGLSSEDRVKVFVADPTNGGKNLLPIRNGNEKVFVSGMNLAWDDFANDLDVFDETFFTEVFDNIKSAGGNSLRWWLHTNGRNSPKFGADGKVTGIELKEIINMRRALDLAYERGIVISMCLWSFDMLQNQGQNQMHMKQLVENKSYTQTYIDKALIPILNEIGNHPAVMTWEIFNEGEGMTTEFGWAHQRTQMKYVQQFVNLLAGAIHRHAPGALVSNSGWSFKAGTDIEGNFNYYTDERLIAAGGDELGTLDFYQIHYYPEHFGNELSPFHRPASHWQLDKPIVIGEFPVTRIDGKADPHLTTTEAYKRAYEYGYAGVMSWTYTGFNDGDFDDAVEGMNYLRTNFPDALAVLIDEDRNMPPAQIAPMPEVNIISGEAASVNGVVNLDMIFSDPEDGSNLTFTIADQGNTLLAVAEITTDNQINIILVEGEVGRSEIIIQARDSEGYSTWATLSINIQEQNGNLALFKKISSSSNESTELRSSKANDGDQTTRWSSVYADNQHIVVDFDSVIRFDHVKLFWEAAYGESYDLLSSDDSVSWQLIYSESDGDGGEDDITFDPVHARYLQVLGKTRGTVYGFSLWEIEVFQETTTASEDEQENRFAVFPNPASRILVLKTNKSAEERQITVLDIFGKVIAFEKMPNHEIILDVSSWPRGLYIVKSSQPNGTDIRKVILK